MAGNLKKRIKYGIFTVLGGLIIFGAIIYSPLLNIGYVKINGNTTIPREEILQLANLGEPLNVFYVSSAQVQKLLEQDLRIDRAKVHQEGFNRLIVDVVENQSIAMVETNYGYAGVNYQGVIMQVYKNLPKVHPPLLKGIIINDLYVGDNIEQPELKPVLLYLQELAPLYRNELVEVNISNLAGVEMETYTKAKIILGEIKDPHALAAECNAFFQEIHKSEVALDYVNFAYTRPVLKFK